MIGIGLLGGSIGLALRRRGLARRVTGIGRSQDRLEAAREAGIVTDITVDLPAGVADAEIIVVATPVDQIVPLVREVADAAQAATLITDVGSVKGAIVAELASLPSSVPFVGSHPLAGSEQSGFEHARADLLEERVVFVTPAERTGDELTAGARQFWASLGAQVEVIDAEEHDRVMAAASHLPHVVAAALSAAVPDYPPHCFGSGFRDTTRLAAGNVPMWIPILLENRRPVLESLRSLQGTLQQWEEALLQADAGQIEKLLTKGKEQRDSLGS